MGCPGFRGARPGFRKAYTRGFIPPTPMGFQKR
jgi:hypothetical protein